MYFHYSLFRRKLILLGGKNKQEIDVLHMIAYKWSTARQEKARKASPSFSLSSGFGSQVPHHSHSAGFPREPASLGNARPALHSKMQPFSQPSVSIYRFVCPSRLTCKYPRQPPFFPYNRTQSNICSVHAESCERSIRIHTSAPQNAFNELQQSWRRAPTAEPGTYAGSSPTQTIQTCARNLFPFPKRGGCVNAPGDGRPQCRRQQARDCGATLGAGSPAELPGPAARGWRGFISPQPQGPARPPPYFT